MKNLQVNDYKKEKKPARNLQIRLPSLRPVQKGGVYKILLSFLLLLVLLVLIVFAWVNFAKRPIEENASEFAYFEVEEGYGALKVGDELEQEGLIRSKWAFYFLSRSDSRSIKAGHYKLSKAMALDEILEKIKNASTDAYSVTIPEGFRSLQIAKLLSQSQGVDVMDFVESATGKEGTLFPDTYLFPRGYEPAKIVREMQENFEKRISGLTVSDDDLIVASIVEREAKNDDERRKISAVYKNRIRENMLLQADPTIRYALDSKKFLEKKSVDFDFWTPITRNDINSLNSEFNTYKQKGLPPAPICNPGLKSIEATVKPEENFDYYYFFHDENGQIHFSKTYSEHLKAISQFGVSG